MSVDNCGGLSAAIHGESGQGVDGLLIEDFASQTTALCRILQ
jgi:hypothetical protein